MLRLSKKSVDTHGILSGELWDYLGMDRNNKAIEKCKEVESEEVINDAVAPLVTLRANLGIMEMCHLLIGKGASCS